VLTGTPVENRLDDLYALMQLVDPTVFGPLWRFNLEFHVQNEKGRITGYKNLRTLRERTSSVVLRRHKETVLTQLPPLVEQTRFTPLTKEQTELEESYRSEAAKLLAIAERRPLRPEEHKLLQGMLLKARQACNALELCDPTYGKAASPKLDEFEALVGEILEQGTSKVLVFSEWVEMLKLAAKRLENLGVGHTMLYGGIPTDQRPALIERFREDPDLRVLLSSDAGGTGLNLQVASYVIHLDLPWNPARLDQRTARAHRLGQTRGVSAVVLCAEKGIERGIEQTLQGKREVRAAALDPTSEVDTLQAPSFMLFAKQLHDVLHATAQPGEDVEEVEGVQESLEPLVARPTEGAVSHGDASETTVPVHDVHAHDHEGHKSPALLNAPGAESDAAQTDNATTPVQHEAAKTRAQCPVEQQRSSTPPAESGNHRYALRARADNRLRLARVVLEAGFPSDAAKAAYEALASSITCLLEDKHPTSHAALVAQIYRDLLPSGRLPLAAPGVLARLHDLTMLEAHGVDVDRVLAEQVVGEAGEWVQRLADGPH
jgi:superfamily II DNA/RNA helicase